MFHLTNIADNSVESSGTFLDPIFSIDPSFVGANNYSIETSPRIGSVSAVPETFDMGDDVSRLRRRWLHGVSSEIEASTDRCLIRDHSYELKSRLRAAFSLSDCAGHVRSWHEPDQAGRSDDVRSSGGRPEVAGGASNRRD
jgi:hypothetical protein